MVQEEETLVSTNETENKFDGRHCVPLYTADKDTAFMGEQLAPPDASAEQLRISLLVCIGVRADKS